MRHMRIMQEKLTQMNSLKESGHHVFASQWRNYGYNQRPYLVLTSDSAI